ncbi:NAD(P)/FAD-dependent oxidoreductase [Kordiimonas aestuarii]|uniref:NAD(P)/FAD-dependent oxidoreductase n=1 Tax=Kordiimonas aestuarii TaxID=1005925 RepID=UPI0021D1CB1D|nr:FAD-dependent oxidoreductase [Kordiimonas aestuarii]
MLHNAGKNRPRNSQKPGKNIAIIGSGITGLSAAWLLSKTHNVTLYEKENYLGGHAHTVDISVDDKTFPVDTGFIVYNPANYPNLTALFDHLDIASVKTDMSFSVSMDDGRFEYSGGDGGGLFAQPGNFFRPRFWSMIGGIVRFYDKAAQYCTDPSYSHMTLGELLSSEGYSPSFVRDHLGPMGAAIWSSNSQDILEYPAVSFLNFFRNHGLVQLRNRPEWRTVAGGSREYVKAVSHSFQDNIRLACAAMEVTRLNNGIRVRSSNGDISIFNEVVFACHSDQALALINHPAPELAHALRYLRYSKNSVVLHTDTELMPKRTKAWASWNYIEHKQADTKGPSVSYWMNRLQPLPVETPVIVTLNPNRDIDPDKVLQRYAYDHPVFDQNAALARQRLWALQGRHNFWFAGAYLGHGFHEDGIQAGLSVAEMIGSPSRPWQKPAQNARIGLPDTLTTIYQGVA